MKSFTLIALAAALAVAGLDGAPGPTAELAFSDMRSTAHVEATAPPTAVQAPDIATAALEATHVESGLTEQLVDVVLANASAQAREVDRAKLLERRHLERTPPLASASDGCGCTEPNVNPLNFIAEPTQRTAQLVGPTWRLTRPGWPTGDTRVRVFSS